MTDEEFLRELKKLRAEYEGVIAEAKPKRERFLQLRAQLAGLFGLDGENLELRSQCAAHDAPALEVPDGVTFAIHGPGGIMRRTYGLVKRWALEFAEAVHPPGWKEQ